MNIKLVAIDMDGTFLDSNCRVPKRNLEAIQKAMAKGVIIVPATGRCYRNTKKAAFEGVEGISYYITANGAVVVDAAKEEVIFEKAIPAKAAKEVYEIAKRYPAFIEIYTGLDVYVDEKGINHLFSGQVMKSYCEQIIETATRVKDLSAIVGDSNILVSKYHILSQNVEENVKLRDEIAAIEGLNPISVIPQNIELVEGVWSKKDGLQKVMEICGVSKDEVLVIGDSNNDYDAMEWATHAVAMGNATDRVKAVASDITGTNDEAGVAQTLEKYLGL